MTHRLLPKLIPFLFLAACTADKVDTEPQKEKSFQLEFPMACSVGENCWPMNYVDHDTQAGVVTDASCKARSYDGHKGTDIAIRDWSAVLEGVDILAPASGTVLGVRNGETDQFPTSADKARMAQRGRECGNGVRIDHGGGWTTQFCHMKKGSVNVAFEQEIRSSSYAYDAHEGRRGYGPIYGTTRVGHLRP